MDEKVLPSSCEEWAVTGTGVTNRRNYSDTLGYSERVAKQEQPFVSEREDGTELTALWQQRGIRQF